MSFRSIRREPDLSYNVIRLTLDATKFMEGDSRLAPAERAF